MKVVFMCGSHKRHFFVANKLLDAGFLAGMVIEEREEMVPIPPDGLSDVDRDNFIKHFALRDEAEEKYFGHVDIDKIKKTVPNILVNDITLNDKATFNFVKDINADYLFSYGVHKIHDDIINLYENRSFNIHGGLSPWYKGTITLFWPFYFLRPNWAGMTIHRLTGKIDGGQILHHSTPVLERGDKLHEVACKAVEAVGEDLCTILKTIESGREPACHEQKSNGKLFASGDWNPQHLRLVYNCFNDDIVDRFLDGELISEAPKLIKFF